MDLGHGRPRRHDKSIYGMANRLLCVWPDIRGDRRVNTPTLRLPRMVESDPRGSQLLLRLATHTRPLWPKGEIEVPVATLDPELTNVLRNAHSAEQVVRGLENAERTLAAEERGLRMADQHSGVTRGVRVSRLLLLADDGADRFYRRVETLLRRHGPRVLAVRLDVGAGTLGELLYGPARLARLLMLMHKEAVGAALLAIAGEGGDQGVLT